jgi:hypothetical protein
MNFHSPGARIMWMDVHCGGVNRDVAVPNQSLRLLFGLQFDNSLRIRSGYFYLGFYLYQDGSRSGGTWSGWTSTQMPASGGNIWVSYSWSQATHATGGRHGLLLYRPQVIFNTWGAGGGLTGDDEFAVAEEDHYIYIE